ncbi:MAG: hypothetical protein KA436_05900 [Oligoflexales bacterium]|nr:hypothetical protein [Oligoflexales bacterium]
MEKKPTRARERGTTDDWETIKVVLDQVPALRQRVMFKLRELRNAMNRRQQGISISKKDTLSFRLSSSKKKGAK